MITVSSTTHSVTRSTVYRMPQGAVVRR
jgi:hypothetical protein